MPVIQIADVQPQPFEAPTFYDYERNQRVATTPLREFIVAQCEDKKTDWRTKKSNQTLFHRRDNFASTDVFHRNYMLYLEQCWKSHHVAVVSPDILWYTLLCELTQIVKANVEDYRHLFSTSAEKQTITVSTLELVVMPLEQLLDGLKGRVPTDTDLFLPKFSTETDRSRSACVAAFADMCSPYYNYCMLACGIPAIDVRGTPEDWYNLGEAWKGLAAIFAGFKSYFERVQALLDKIAYRAFDPTFWTEMFDLARCGSGGDKVVKGWYKDLYLEQPRLAYPGNYSSLVSVVPYTQVNTQKNYEMHQGLFSSRKEGDTLVPEFSAVVLEKIAA